MQFVRGVMPPARIVMFDGYSPVVVLIVVWVISSARLFRVRVMFFFFRIDSAWRDTEAAN